MAEQTIMSTSDDAIGQGLQGLMKSLKQEAGSDDGRALPPVHLWNPEHCGDIGMQILRDGTWMHDGTRFTRDRLVRLFSTILRKDEDGFYLVTPVEKVIVHVEDVPFIVTRVERHGDGVAQSIIATTNVGDVFTIDADHAIRVETDDETGEPSPYVHVRAGLEARFNRPSFYELVSWAELDDSDDSLHVVSAGQLFELGKTT